MGTILRIRSPTGQFRVQVKETDTLDQVKSSVTKELILDCQNIRL